LCRRDLLRVFARTDAEIAAEVTTDLASSEQVPDGEVSVSVDDGVMTVSGGVADATDLAGDLRVAWRVPGVVDVVDRLMVSEAPGASSAVSGIAPGHQGRSPDGERVSGARREVARSR
jgi:hypothetical protein